MKFKEAVKLKSIDSLILDIEQIKVSSANNSNNNLQVPSISKTQQTTSNQELYQKVIQKVYDRNIDLGDCFKKSFIFSLFNKESKVIFLDSFATGECKKILWRSFKDIRMFIEDIFGIGVKIEFNKKVEQEKKNLNDLPQISNTAISETPSAPIPQPIPAPPTKTPIEEILDSPMIQTINKLFH